MEFFQLFTSKWHLQEAIFCRGLAIVTGTAFLTLLIGSWNMFDSSNRLTSFRRTTNHEGWMPAICFFWQLLSMKQIPLTSGFSSVTVSSCGTSSLFQKLYVRLMQVMWNRWILPRCFLRNCLGGYGLPSTGSGWCGKTKAASVDGGKELFCPGTSGLNLIPQTANGVWKVRFFLNATFYLWLQRFGYRDPNTWWESYWALKICSNNIKLQEPFAFVGVLFIGEC